MYHEWLVTVDDCYYNGLSIHHLSNYTCHDCVILGVDISCDLLTSTELCPLTEEEVTTYGSHGYSSNDRVSDEYVVISESSEGEGSLHEDTDGDRLEGLPACPPSSHGGILKTVHDSKVGCSHIHSSFF